MLIDLHCHTSRYSACSSLSPDALLEGARAAGLDGVCLTEHDRLWPEADLRRLGEEHGIVVLRGIEVTTEVGHVLVFGVDAPPTGMFIARSLVAAVRAAGGLTALAHPGRGGQPAIAHDSIATLFDLVEVLNGSDGVSQNESARAWSAQMSLPGIGGSDCHAVHEIGTVATVLPRCVCTEGELVEALRMGQHTVRRVR